MRVRALESGHRPLQKLQFALLRPLAGGTIPPPILLMSYRRDRFGRWMARCFQEAMRKGREWTSFETEVFAAFVSKVNRCEY
jgi:hypothetical protein